jgi:hypothetical protein
LQAEAAEAAVLDVIPLELLAQAVQVALVDIQQEV